MSPHHQKTIINMPLQPSSLKRLDSSLYFILKEKKKVSVCDAI